MVEIVGGCIDKQQRDTQTMGHMTFNSFPLVHENLRRLENDTCVPLSFSSTLILSSIPFVSFISLSLIYVCNYYYLF